MPDITTLITSGALSAALVFLLRGWISQRLKSSIQHEYDQKLETHKAKLSAESEIAIEHLKSQLQIAAAERNIKLTKIFEQQAEVIAEVFAKLVRLIASIEEYTAIMTYEGTPSMAERRKKVGERMTDFVDYYHPKKVFLPAPTQKRIDAFVKELNLKTIMFMRKVEQGRERAQSPEEDTWFQTMNFMNKDVAQIMADLDQELKTILGLSETNPTVENQKH
ncbi:MAG TPA: hypothetical protein VFV23_08515 [Verrucomicrobiae bacterium]|nr:hypothetical protein [Verrucomicrobiae bacterium]